MQAHHQSSLAREATSRMHKKGKNNGQMRLLFLPVKRPTNDNQSNITHKHFSHRRSSGPSPANTVNVPHLSLSKNKNSPRLGGSGG